MHRRFHQFALAILLASPSAHLVASDAKPVVVEQLAKTTKSWEGSSLPGYASGQPEITILQITIQPGVQLPWHTHPVINAGFITKGTLTVITKDGKRIVLSAGDSIVEAVNLIHRGINEGSEPAEIIVFYAGLAGTPITLVSE